MVLSVSLPVLNFFFDTYIRLRTCKESYNLFGVVTNLFGTITRKSHGMEQIYSHVDLFKAEFVAANTAASDKEKAEQWVDIMLKLGELGNDSQAQAYNDSLFCETLNACRTFVYDMLKQSPAGLDALKKKITDLNATAATPLDPSKRLRYLAYLYDYDKLDASIVQSSFPAFATSKAKIVTTQINDMNVIFPDPLKPNFFQIFVKMHTDMGHLSTDDLIQKITLIYCINLGLCVLAKAPTVRTAEPVNDDKASDEAEKKQTTSLPTANDSDAENKGSSEPTSTRGERDKNKKKPSLFPPVPSSNVSSSPVVPPPVSAHTANSL